MAVERAPLPGNALLAAYAESGAYTDCYCTHAGGDVSLSDYVAAFYTTWLFKVERVLIKWFASLPSTDAEAVRLASGETKRFAAWNVERRTEQQLLLIDINERTRSWLMVEPASGDSGTRLYFGSAVIPEETDDGEKRLGTVFRLLLGFHKVYSVLLLRAARAKLQR